MAFRPTFWATVVAVPVFVILVGLGTWQLQRLAWKNDLIQTRTERIAAAPLTVDEALNATSPEAVEYRPIELNGVLHSEHAYRLLNRVRDGRQGFHVVSPMVLEDGRGTVMLDRGWAPREMFDTPPEGAAAPVRITGYIRAYTEPGAFLPDNEPQNNNWFHMNEAQMLAAAGASGGVGFYVEAGPGAAAGEAYPVGAVPSVNLRNSHLEYVVTWYGLAAVLLVIFVVFHWRRGEA